MQRFGGNKRLTELSWIGEETRDDLADASGLDVLELCVAGSFDDTGGWIVVEGA